MVELIDINIDEFKKIIYPEYIKLFPEAERKSYKRIEKCFENGILKIIKIVDNDKFIGFIMTNTIEDNKYLQLDYLAILPQYQDKGYGTKALKILKENSKEYNGIFIEVEKVGLGENEEENKLRQRRVEFYERIGFDKLHCDFDLYNVIYTPYVLQTSNNKEDEDKVIKDVFDIYNAILGKERVEKNCKVIK